MHHGADNDARNSIDNPTNVGADDSARQPKVKKDVQNQIQEANTQKSFKVNPAAKFLFCSFYVAPSIAFFTVASNTAKQLTQTFLAGSNK